MQNWACILFHILFVSHRFYLIFCCGLFDRNAASFLVGRTCGVVPPFTGFYWVLLERTIQLRCFFFLPSFRLIRRHGAFIFRRPSIIYGSGVRGHYGQPYTSFLSLSLSFSIFLPRFGSRRCFLSIDSLLKQHIDR